MCGDLKSGDKREEKKNAPSSCHHKLPKEEKSLS
jgi:hypothetical protein